MGPSKKQLKCDDYHVAWICPVANVELLPSRLMLDEEHLPPTYNTHYDENTYIFGAIHGHAVVVATCPQGSTGNVNAGCLTGSMFKSFPSIRVAVLVGIGGGIPRREISNDSLENIHLGDVVVGWPGDHKPACVYHDRGRSKADGHFEIVGTMQDPDWRLTTALSILTSDHEMDQTNFDDQLARLRRHKNNKKFAHPGLEFDRLYNAAYHHSGDYGSECTSCNSNELVQRPPRTEDEKRMLVFHLGSIVTGNAVIQNGELRDQISEKCDGALCVEMEAAGIDANRRCLIIRGISDYADSHKNDMWRSHAAGNAAAFTRELLCRISPDAVKDMEGVTEAPWLVPIARLLSFVGRKSQLDLLSAHISKEGYQRLAICGLGGCGKTALALESAYRLKKQQPLRAIFWVSAVSRESFEQAYREIWMNLSQNKIVDDTADIMRLVKAKLSDERFGQWLMIVDNADDTSVLLKPLDQERVTTRLIDTLPRSRKGSIIFATRSESAAVDLAGNNIVELGRLNKPEAKEVLRMRLVFKHHHQIEDEEIVDEFLNILAFHALAIIQAVAFINENNSTVSDYINLYRESEQEATALLSGEFVDDSRYRETKNPIATTWFISFEHIRKQNELAAELLSFMACTANNEIPKSMLPVQESKVRQAEAIGTLKAYAFITERKVRIEGQRQESLTGEYTRAFDVHPLVHLAMRGWLKAHNQWKIWGEKASDRLIEIIPYGDHGTSNIWTAYLSHATHLIELPDVCETSNKMSLLDRIGCCEHTIGRYKAASRAHKRLLSIREIILGKEHPDTLTSMNNLAQALSDQGRYAEAEKMHRETLALREKVLGKEHPATLTSMNSLALALSDQGKYAEAEKMHRETSGLSENVSGKEHPATLASMNNLALALSGQRKYVEAEKMHRETVALREMVLGKEHRATLASMNNLALALSGQEKYAEAENMHRETVALRKMVFGKEHRATLASMDNLALALSDQRKYAEAEKMHRETLALRKMVLGKEHRATLASMNNLALALSGQRKYAEAEKMHRETLALREKVSGKEHPKTLMSMNNLAKALSDQWRYAEAEKMHLETLGLREKVSGKEHRATLTSKNNLALALSDQRKYAEAEKMHRESLALREKVSEKEHPKTLMSMNDLAKALSDQGRYAEAEKMHLETSGLREKVSGKEHPVTLTSKNNLALALSDQGRYAEAEKMHLETLGLREKVSGKEHPATLTSKNNLALALSDQGKYAEAEKMRRRTLVLVENVSGKEHPDLLTSMYDAASRQLYPEAELLSTLPSNFSRPSYNTCPTSVFDNSQNNRQSLIAAGDQEDNLNTEKNQVSGAGCLEAADVDLQSVVSDREEIFSQISICKTEEELFAEKLLIRFLAQHEVLKELCQIASDCSTKEDFVRNFRRLLKRYHLDIAQSAKTYLERMTAGLLRSRRSRLRIAETIFDERTPEADERHDPFGAVLLEAESRNSLLQKWIAQSSSLQNSDLELPEDNEGFGNEMAKEESDSLASDSDCAKDVDDDRASNISQEKEEDGRQSASQVSIAAMEETLQASNAFQSLLTNTCLFLLPPTLASLSRILLTIPSERIWFSSEDNCSLINRAKCFVEDVTEENWIWWPLQPRMRLLGKDQTRVYWECHCGSSQWAEISLCHAKLYKLMLKNRSTLRDNHLCRSRRLSPWHVFASKVKTVMSGSSPARNMPRGTIEEANLPVYPQNVLLGTSGGDASANSIHNRSIYDPTASRNNQTANIDIPSKPHVLLGVRGPSISLKLEQIEVMAGHKDDDFFEKLLEAYKECRGFWRNWLSIWKLCHCDFVKFKKVRAKRIFPDGKGLPPEGPDYEYQPCPALEDPPISPHEFELLLKTCPSN